MFNEGPAFEWKRDETTYAFLGLKQYSVRLGLWVVVLVYGVMWLGAVWMWQRRKARVMRVVGGNRESDDAA